MSGTKNGKNPLFKKYNPEEWKTREETAKILGVKPRTLIVKASTGRIPEKAIIRPIVGKMLYHIPTLLNLN